MNDTVRSFVEAEKQASRNVTKACELLEVLPQRPALSFRIGAYLHLCRNIATRVEVR